MDRHRNVLTTTLDA